MAGQPLTLLAVVSPSHRGRHADRPGRSSPRTAQSIGSATLDATGSASLTVAATAGSHVYAASFAGSTGNPGSSSAGLVVTVASSTTTTLGGPTSPVTTGQSITLAAEVAATSGVPTGMVDFTEDGRAIGTVALDAGGAASLTIAATVGTHTFAAAYAGSAAYASASGPVAVTAVTPTVAEATTTTLDGPSGPATTDQALTFTATVATTSGLAPTRPWSPSSRTGP